MDKKNKTIIIICIVAIVLAIGIATSYVVIKKINREKTKIDVENNQVVQIEQDSKDVDTTPNYEQKTQIIGEEDLI